MGVSSLIDTWIVVRELEETGGRRRIRGLYIVKSRGMNHSSDVHKLVLSDNGIDIVPMDADEPQPEIGARQDPPAMRTQGPKTTKADQNIPATLTKSRKSK